MAGVRLELRGISKSYGAKIVLSDISLEIDRSEFFTLLGPSGCGKTTLLNIIAGLVEPDRGSVLFDGEDVTRLPPHKRDVGMVFQDLALFPHMTVAENVAFGLRMRNRSDAEVRRRVREMLELVKLDPGEFWNRYPSQLSGGQQQRVALARALAIEPRILLLDEPLSHVDYKIKQELMAELRRIHRETGVTTVYVTHDQNEAMFLSDRIAVMSFRKIEQVGTPEELYRDPANIFVATFFGEANVIPYSLLNPVRYANGSVMVARPDDTVVVKNAPTENGYLAYARGMVVDKIFLGPQVMLEIDVGGYRVKAFVPRSEKDTYSLGEEVVVAFTSRAKVIEA